MGTSGEHFQFRSREVVQAVNLLDEIRREGINKSELGRTALKSALQDVAKPEEKAIVFAAFRRGEVSEEVARLYLGDALDTMQADADEVASAIEADTSQLVQE